MLLENVPNLLRHDKGDTFRTILAHLRKLGYDVYYDVLNASDYGVPQARKRVYMV
jgi:DNA (cytosine-5)-methyltransferase 1